MKNKSIVDFYLYAREMVLDAGYSGEIAWCENRPHIEDIKKETFLQEYAWVVINSGMKNTIAEKIFERFKQNGIESIGHVGKRNAIKYVIDNSDQLFNELKNAEDKLNYLESLPWIGKVTKYHLARNLGIDCAKPDRHLVRLANIYGFRDDVQAMCETISKCIPERIGTIDLVLWRFATITPNYEKIAQEM